MGVVRYLNRCSTGDLVILSSAGLHFAWAAMAAIWGVQQVTSFRTLGQLPPPIFVALFAACAGLAAYGVHTCSGKMRYFLPQQFVMAVCAFDAAYCVWMGHYADGVIYPRVFIAQDQLPAVWWTLTHTLAMLTHSAANRVD